MKTKFWLVLDSLLLGILVFAFPQNAAAQDQDQYPQDQQQYAQDQQDPPSRVARLNYVEGSVSYQPSGSQDWVQADLNRPLTTGDNLWTDHDSRAELHIGSTTFRLGNQTGISFLNLNDQAVQVQLAQGDLLVDLHRLPSDEAYEIDTPNLAFSLVRPGEYRIETDTNGNSTAITVYSGEGSVSGGGQSFNVTPGQQAIFTGTNQLSENVRRIEESDSFYGWARSREVREEHSMSARYVSPDVTGYEDLDSYGSWHADPEYGNYWVPNDVGSEWEPYHVGHWCWVAPWGWTWVDDEPWGFAPFHYGRWAIIGGAWGWVPGPVAVEPVYAPALVGFVGGGGFGVSIAIGSVEGVGWFPLGPRDVYVPAYQVSPRYVQEVNISNTRVINQTTITNVYNNYTVNHVTNVNYTYANNTRAVTVVNRNAFVSGQPVQRGAVRVNREEIQHPRIVTTAALTPSRASVVGAAAAARAKPPETVVNRPRPLVTKMRPAPQADPIGKPRPATNPSLSPAVLQRSGYSPQLQTIRATAAAKVPPHTAPAPAENRPAPGATPTPALPGAPAARPPAATQPRPNTTPYRPFTPPNRPATNPQPNETPNTPVTPPREQPQPNERQPNRPFTPPNRPAVNPRQNEAPNRTVTPPREQPRPEAQPNRPFTPPNRPETNPRPNEAPPRPATPPREQPRPEAQPRVMPPSERQPARPEAQPRPEARPAPSEREPARPTGQPRPEAQPRTAPPPERKAPPEERKAAPPPREEKPQPKPQEKPKEKPKPQPQP